jgi:hypothetical protein
MVKTGRKPTGRPRIEWPENSYEAGVERILLAGDGLFFAQEDASPAWREWLRIKFYKRLWTRGLRLRVHEISRNGQAGVIVWGEQSG